VQRPAPDFDPTGLGLLTPVVFHENFGLHGGAHDAVMSSHTNAVNFTSRMASELWDPKRGRRAMNVDGARVRARSATAGDRDIANTALNNTRKDHKTETSVSCQAYIRSALKGM
jgi:hypothetical protein